MRGLTPSPRTHRSLPPHPIPQGPILRLRGESRGSLWPPHPCGLCLRGGGGGFLAGFDPQGFISGRDGKVPLGHAVCAPENSGALLSPGMATCQLSPSRHSLKVSWCLLLLMGLETTPAAVPTLVAADTPKCSGGGWAWGGGERGWKQEEGMGMGCKGTSELPSGRLCSLPSASWLHPATPKDRALSCSLLPCGPQKLPGAGSQRRGESPPCLARWAAAALGTGGGVPTL